MSNLKKDPKQTYLKITDAVIGVDKDGCLINFDPTIFAGDIDGHVMTISYRYSNSALEPLNPDDAAVGVWGDYALDSQWMAMQERINNILMDWKVFKIKGVKGDKGDPGVKGDQGSPGTPGGAGNPGQASFHSYVFKRSATQPATPTGGAYSSPIPATWSDGIPAEEGNPVWMSSRLFTSNGLSPQHGVWSVPVKIADSETVDYEFSNFTGTNPGNPTYPLNGATWHDTGVEEDVWMAMRTVKNGLYGLWSVIRIKGEDGLPGVSSFTSIVFKRSVNNIPITTKPIGGSYSFPVPSGWSDGIPSGVGSVYQSSRIFSSDGQPPQDPTWSTPALAIDTIYKDYEYSSRTTKPGTPTNEPSAWHNDPQENDIWQAVRDNNNGVFGPWTIQRIKGETGEPGVGYNVVSSNPIYSIAVGSDGIASIAKQVVVSINIYKNILLLSPSASPTGLNDNQFHVVLPTALPAGITVTKDSDNTLRFNIAAGTVLPEAQNIVIQLKVGSELIEMNSVFSIVPITTAEDGQMLVLSSSSNVVSFDSYNNLVAPTSITLSVNQQNYSEVVTWISEPAGIVSGTGLTKTVNTSTFFSGANNSVKVTASTPNGLFDSTTILKVRDGLPGSAGPPGINGTAGPVARTFEWVAGATYENTSLFIDYVYYRDLANTGTSTSRGWYNVIKVGGVDTTAVANAGVPDPLKFAPAPFTAQMTFSTVIAEQANLAGFIFRNQKLYSQANYTFVNSCTSATETHANMTLDGAVGLIDFAKLLTIDKTGIQLNDYCLRPRIVMQWDQLTGIPILRFLNADGSIKWEAGKDGYVEVVVYTTPEKYEEFLGSKFITSTPTGSSDTGFSFCKDGGGTVFITNYEEAMVIQGYYYSKPTPDETATPTQIANHGKMFDKFKSGLIADGWYCTNVNITDPANVMVTWKQYVGGSYVTTLTLRRTPSISPC